MADNVIKIIVGGKDDAIDALDFLKVVRTTISVLDAIKGDTKWLVGNVSRSSPVSIEFVSESVESPKAISTFVSGIRSLNSEPKRPPGFNELALVRSKKLVRPLGNGISELTLVIEGADPVRVTQHVAASVDAICHAPSYEIYTELEGTLGQILVHGHKSEFCIFDEITDKPTTCKFDGKEAESVGALITHRVRVYGKATYSRNHFPKVIEVERWKGPIGEDAPTFRDVHDAKIRIASKESSEGIIRRLRDTDA